MVRRLDGCESPKRRLSAAPPHTLRAPSVRATLARRLGQRCKQSSKLVRRARLRRRAAALRAPHAEKGVSRNSANRPKNRAPPAPRRQNDDPSSRRKSGRKNPPAQRVRAARRRHAHRPRVRRRRRAAEPRHCRWTARRDLRVRDVAERDRQRTRRGQGRERAAARAARRGWKKRHSISLRPDGGGQDAHDRRAAPHGHRPHLQGD